MGWKHLTTRFWRWKNMNALRWKLFGGTWWVCSRFFCKEEFFACAQKGSLCSPRSGASWGGEAAGMWKAHPWRAGNWAWSTGNPSIFLTRGLKGIHLPPFSIPLTHFKWNLLVERAWDSSAVMPNGRSQPSQGEVAQCCETWEEKESCIEVINESKSAFCKGAGSRENLSVW